MLYAVNASIDVPLQIGAMTDTSSGRSAFNSPPVNLREVSEHTYVLSSFFNRIPTHIEYRQVYIDKPNLTREMIELTMFYHPDNTGYALSRKYWDGKMRYFLFGCEHKWKSTNIGRCLSRDTCTECGYTTVIDSSD